MATVRVVTAKNGSEAAGAWLNDRAAKLVLVLEYMYGGKTGFYQFFCVCTIFVHTQCKIVHTQIHT